ncbi:MAG: 4Fe-4S dicluster domain-containing protein [Firmicutes bacterium]|nr:4Fe-4S dicluster domain-containing protein [Alicyclobacillaceae bacterium]MCL6497527.1 4Fe-4S dicluster domain-containing protein [Bacillota bacterium]
MDPVAGEPPESAALVADRLETVKFRVDSEPHIRVDTTRCQGCELKPCLWVCPAQLFTLSGEEVLFSYEGCLECGTCYVACGLKAISWQYPRGGYGVMFRDA